MISFTFTISSLIYIIMLGIIYFSKNRIDNLDNKLYSSLIVVTVFGIIMQIASLLIDIYNILSPNSFINIFICKSILIYYIVWITIFALYVYFASKDKQVITKKMTNIIKIGGLIVAAVIYSSPLEIVHEGSNAYPSGFGVVFGYICSALLLLFMIGNVIVNIKKIKTKKYIPLFVFFALGFIVIFIQSKYPDILLITPLETFITFILYYTIENPDIKVIQELNIARDMAEKANSAKTDFLSSMSHEIRTPLNAIVGFSQCIQDAGNLEVAKENARDIITASNTLLDIVNGILDISKIEAGKLEVVNTRYKSSDLFENVSKLVMPRMEEKGLDFQINIAQDIPKYLYGDYANFKKVITNLLSNASKYTDKGSVTYTVNCVNQDNTCRLMISVEDTGRGIKEESISKLFTRFERVDEDKNSTIEGTGLGLAITKKIVEMMNGKIIVQSVYGSGSKFTVLVDQKIDSDQTDTEEENVKDNSEINIDNKKFLVVDDNKLNLKVASKIINSMYPSVLIDTIDSGQGCIDLISSGNKYDLIFMDDMMPKMSGVETFHKLQKSGNFKTPVIALTANAINGMREKYIDEGFNDYLSKPIDRNDLTEVLLRIFSYDGESTIMKEITAQLPKINGMEKEKTSLLINNGVDVNHALELLGDLDMYNETLDSFLNEIQEKINKLNKYRKNKDMTNYAILVHSLKSDSKYLGFMKLAEIAYEHELKSKENDRNYIDESFKELVNELRRVINIAIEYRKEDR